MLSFLLVSTLVFFTSFSIFCFPLNIVRTGVVSREPARRRFALRAQSNARARKFNYHHCGS
jgi:hypothetical protein